jgi:hypothetical protein
MASKIDFRNKVYNQKLNYTVRKGDKWFNSLHLEDYLLIDVPCDKDGFWILNNDMGIDETEVSYHEPTIAIVFDIDKCLLKDLPKKVYDFEHDPYARHRDGLVERMIEAYDDDFCIWDNELVTYIGFILIDGIDEEEEDG